MNVLWKIWFEGFQAKKGSRGKGRPASLRSLKLMFTHVLLVFSSSFIIKEVYNSAVCNKQLPDFFLLKQVGYRT